MEQQFMATQEANSPNITNDSELNREGTGPATEESESHQEMTVPAMEHSTAPSGDLPIKVQQGNESAGEESDPDGWVIVPQMGPFTDPSEVKVHTLVAGETFNIHETFMQKLKLQIELCSAESSDVILVFCPVVSRIGTDMEAAMARVTGNKPVILVFMHHCHDPSHMTNITVQPCRSNIVQVVHCAFHELVGLLECQENEQAVAKVHTTLLRCVDLHAEVPQCSTKSDITPQMMEAHDDITHDSEAQSTEPVGERSESHHCKDVRKKEDSGGSSGDSTGLMSMWSFLSPSELLSTVSSWLSAVVSWLYRNSSVKAHTLVVGGTFQAHETFMQKLKLQIELCSAESSNVILVFCPVVSRIGTDMEAAMARVTDNKPVILVFMHHCHNPSHMTNITVQPSRSNIVQVVHCAYHETKGLLQCQENEQAVAEVYLTLLRYVDVHAEVPQCSTKSDIEQQPVAAQDDITHDSEPQSTEPVGERSESHHCKDVTEMADSSSSSGGHAPEVLQSKVDHSNVDMEEKPMAAHDDKRPQKRPSEENSVCPSSGVPTTPKKTNYAS